MGNRARRELEAAAILRDMLAHPPREKQHPHRLYAYGADVPITYHSDDWYAAHQNDVHVHWLADPDDDRGYYDVRGTWHEDPGARAVQGGVTGAALGAAIGCVVTLPVGCAPGVAVGAAVGAVRHSRR